MLFWEQTILFAGKTEGIFLFEFICCADEGVLQIKKIPP